MSLIKANDIQNTSGGIPTVKGQKLIPTAWVNFNGTGTVAISDSENVSSITDNGTGNYTMNFTVAMANATYAVAMSAGAGTGSTNFDRFTTPYSLATGSVSLKIWTSSSGSDDQAAVTVIVLGEQS